jgi:hypothetical protein
MSTAKLSEIEALIEALDLEDQARLLQFLTPRIAGAILSEGSATDIQPSRKTNAAWHAYRAAGDRLAKTSTPGSTSVTEAVNQSRR